MKNQTQNKTHATIRKNSKELFSQENEVSQQDIFQILATEKKLFSQEERRVFKAKH